MNACIFIMPPRYSQAAFFLYKQTTSIITRTCLGEIHSLKYNDMAHSLYKSCTVVMNHNHLRKGISEKGGVCDNHYS